MLDRSWRRRIAFATAAGGVALALAAAPIAPDGELPGFALKVALAKAGGDKGGNGADKGNKGGKKGGAGGAGATILVNTEDSHGKGHTGKGNGHRKDVVSGVLSSHNGPHPENHGALTSLLGSLNAAHAIANGNTNDNPNSRVGQIWVYVDRYGEISDPEDGDAVDEAAQALTDAWNKDTKITDNASVTTVVDGVNDLLGIDEEGVTDTEQAVADKISPPAP
jgi:hypothetical protein